MAMSLYSNTNHSASHATEAGPNTPWALTATRLAFAGGIVAVALIGIFAPVNAEHKLAVDLIAGFVGGTLAAAFARKFIKE
jgi:hypothetical protein